MALTNWINKLYLLIFAAMGSSFILSVALAGTPSSSATSAVSTALCSIVATVQAVVGVIALVMFILGGALYAIAHMMPAAGNLRGNMQGWALGMIVGGIVGIIIVIAAPGIINMLVSSSSFASTAVTCS